jgi:hypothetical protein
MYFSSRACSVSATTARVFHSASSPSSLANVLLCPQRGDRGQLSEQLAGQKRAGPRLRPDEPRTP